MRQTYLLKAIGKTFFKLAPATQCSTPFNCRDVKKASTTIAERIMKSFNLYVRILFLPVDQVLYSVALLGVMLVVSYK